MSDGCPISMSSIDRLMTVYRRKKTENENADFLSHENGNAKELAPIFSLRKVEFDLQTRTTRIEILQSQKYRTTVRYVTRDYVRYPILSEWKTREKILTKTIKMTNSVLEGLQTHDDDLIKKFAFEIVYELHSESLLPSWFIKRCVDEEYKESLRSLTTQKNNYKYARENEIKILQSIIAEQNRIIENETLHLEKKTARKEKVCRKIEKIVSAKRSTFLAVITFGIRAYLLSARRKDRLTAKSNKINGAINVFREKIKTAQGVIATHNERIAEITRSIRDKENETNRRMHAMAKEYAENLSKITPLPTEVEVGGGFTLLKTIIGMEYKKIIGCYIIRNREKNKFYVGQSKDVLKRLHQHFHGTEPNNIIFAEDFYMSMWQNKDELFEVKIIPCSTKDELDRTERELIAEYDAYSHGYNGTGGNT